MSLGGLIFLLVVGGGIYAAVIFGPVYLEHYDVKQAVRTAVNQARVADDKTIRRDLMKAIGHVGSHKVVQEDGTVVEEPGITEEAVVIERDPATLTIRIRVEYYRDVQLRPTDKVRRLQFVIDRSGQFERV